MSVKGFVCLMAFLCTVVTPGLGADRVKGNGTLETRKIKLSDFNEIKVDVVMDLTYEQSEEEPYLEVTVDENLHPYVLAEVKDRTLSLGFTGAKVDHFTKYVVKTNSRWLKQARIGGNANFTVNTPLTGDETTVKAGGSSLVQLKGVITVGKLSLDVNGSANIVVDELQVSDLDCDITGSGTITMKKGSAKTGSYTIVNNGEIEAVGIAIPQLSCRITGSGVAQVHATDLLKATVIGKGKIRYKGPTAVQEKKIGGTIEEIKEEGKAL